MGNGACFVGASVFALVAACSATNETAPSGSGGVLIGSGGATASGGSLSTGGFDTGSGALGNIGGNLGTGGAPAAHADSGTPTRQKVTLDECGANNPAGVSAADVQKLVAGGARGDFKLGLPYDGTVFPRGLIAPLLIWQTANAQAVYVHVTSKLFEYKGCLKPALPGEVQLPQNVWDTAGVQTEGADDPFTIEVTVMDGGVVKGPATRKITIAQATLKGSVYYNSYNSTMSGTIVGGAVLRVVPGKNAELFLRVGACTGCHAVSSDGSRIVAREIGGLVDGSVYSITPSTGPNPTPARAGLGTAFVGLSPDGKVYLSTAVQNGVGPRTTGALPLIGNLQSTLYETDSGNVVADTGIPQTALMPTFSPDGRHLVFNDFAIKDGHGLATMRFDGATRKGTEYKKVAETSGSYPGWPFYLPDNGAVVFSQTDSKDFSGGGAGILPALTPSSDLAILDVASGLVTPLGRAMGFDKPTDIASNTTYLPFGAQELHHSFYPTVSPVAAGGYFWIFFDSIRSYGSLGLVRQLWGAAITISPDGKYPTDPSHPAFYLTGQEPHTANHRAFTALDPCRKDGDKCETGVDCCSGFCTNSVCGVPTVPRCSETGEACKGNGDCCISRQSCINGFCSKVLE